MWLFKEEQKQWSVPLLTCIALWAVFCWRGITTAAEIWWGNEIFNHCFFVIPGAIYFIYLKRNALFAVPFKSSLLPLLVIIPSLFVYVVGIAGDVNLFLHMATFVLLPALIWAVIGHRAAYTILFPLCFMLFSIPVGEQLIPLLQKITADGAVALLKVTGIPLFRNGLYIEIPQGRFLVAEACSGVSFFVASLVIGSLYAYLNFATTRRRISFMIISFALPILANIVRVYGIIFIAYKTDMEYAAGADHIIYGWFFFAFVILCLIGIGELLREPGVEWEAEKPAHNNYAVTIASSHKILVPAVIIGAIAWSLVVSSSLGKVSEATESKLITLQHHCDAQSLWEPVLNNPDEYGIQGIGSADNCHSFVAQAWFSGNNNELVSDLNRLFDPKGWSLLSTTSAKLSVGSEVLPMTVYEITSPTERRLFLQRVYIINERIFSSGIKAKIYQIQQALTGSPVAGAMVIVAAPSLDSATATLTGVLEL